MTDKLNFDATTARRLNQKPNTFMRTQTLKKFGLLCSLGTALLVGEHRANAQISVGANGLAPQTFDTLPPVTSWSTRTIVGAAGDLTTVLQMDTLIQTNSATNINTPLVSAVGNPPVNLASGMWASEGRYLLTRPTGNRFTILMATLRNNSNSNLTGITIAYGLTNLLPTAEQIPGNSVYFSLTGGTGTWQKVTTLSGLGTSGTVGTNLTLGGNWAVNSNLYLIWTDDNGSGGPDTAVVIDNFAVSLPFPSITNQPQDSSVAPGQNVTLTVGASGNQPLYYQWLKNSNIIANATNSAYTLVNAQPSDGGFYMVIVSNAFGTARSSNALVIVNCSAPATFVTAPADQSLSPGATLTLSSVAAGTSPILYQWYKNGTPIAGATSNSYTKLNVQPTDSGLYTLTMDNCAQLPISASAVVSIGDTPYAILGLTNSFWRYNETGVCLDGTTWKETNYNDSAWPQGRGVFGLETAAAVAPLINTPMALTAPGGSSQTLTYYLRTQFVLTNDPRIVTFVTSNLVDDGAVFYLNGREVYRINMLSGVPECDTVAPGAATEGVFVVTNIPSSFFVQGTNTVAVELHQNSPTSSDIVFGMQLNVLPFSPTLLAITNQPQSKCVEENQATTFSVGVQGNPVFYQWYTNGVAISNATVNPLTISAITTNDVGNYFVVVGNNVNSVTSSVVTLCVLTDTNAPTLVEADGTGSSLKVLVSFSELILNSTATNLLNYKITNTLGGTLTISSAVLTNGTNVLLTTTAARLANNNYLLIVSGVKDASPQQNTILTNSMIPISQLATLITLEGGDWNYFFDFPTTWPGPGWQNIAFDVSNWGNGPAGLAYFGADESGNLAFGIGTALSWGSTSYYFRNRFNSTISPGGAKLYLQHGVDDGAIFYMNGSEVLRFNMPSGPVGSNTFASSRVEFAILSELTEIPGGDLLRFGTNVLASEVHIEAAEDAEFLDIVFAAKLVAKVKSFVVGPVIITSGPKDQTVIEGQSATFSVEQVGGSVFQWQLNNAPILGATNATYTVANVTTNMEGAQYRVAVSNATAGVFSANAQLHVIVDTNAPVLLSGVLISANSVLLGFSESMAITPAQNTANYVATNTAGAATAISSAVLNNGTNVLLTFASPLNGRTIVVVNNLTDTSSRANLIAPNSAVVVGVDYVIPFTSSWKYLIENTNEVTQTSYFAPGYDDSSWQGPSPALFYVEGAALPAPKNTPLVLTTGGNMINTFYFRQNYVALIGVSNLTLRIRHIIDDGLLLYLNGVEIYRHANMPGGTITAASQALAAIGDAAIAGPFDRTVNLLPGTNVFAAEVHQNGAASSDVVFGIEMTGSIPSAPIPAPEAVRIVEQPRSRTNSVSSTAFFRSTAAGTGPITLQWYKNGVILPGETGSLLTITNVSAASLTNYYLRAANSFSSATSSLAVLTVIADTNCPPIPPAIWTNQLRFNTNGLRTSITYSNGTTRAVLNWSNPITNGAPCNNYATVILQRSIGLRTPSASTLWTNVYTNVSGTVTVTNALTGTNTVYYRLMVP